MRAATWTNIGTDVKGCKNIENILVASNLNYEVVKKPIFTAEGFEIPDKIMTAKKETGEYIGILSPKYKPYQNTEAFKFIENIDDIEFVRAGETHKGMVYIIGKLPSVNVLHDEFAPYVIFQTSHNGLYPLKATICPLRIVCQNQFAMSFRNMNNSVTVRHSSQLESRIAQAHKLIADTATYMNGFANTAEELAALKIGGNQGAYRIIDAFFEATKQKIADEEESKRAQTSIKKQKEEFIRCYHADDNKEFEGTAWGLLNGFTDFTTHIITKKTAHANESKFEKATLDTTKITKLIECIKETV